MSWPSGIGDDVIHAGPQTEQNLQAGKASEQPVLRLPHHRIAHIRQAEILVVPPAYLKMRRLFGQSLAPFRDGVLARSVYKDNHATFGIRNFPLHSTNPKLSGMAVHVRSTQKARRCHFANP